jgi:DNA repair exonuclease SbcCD ATPase subunit
LKRKLKDLPEDLLESMPNKKPNPRQSCLQATSTLDETLGNDTKALRRLQEYLQVLYNEIEQAKSTADLIQSQIDVLVRSHDKRRRNVLPTLNSGLNDPLLLANDDQATVRDSSIARDSSSPTSS